MVKQEYINRLVGIQGFSVSDLAFIETECHTELAIHIVRTHKSYTCRCGRQFDTYHDRNTRQVRDLPFGPYRITYLIFEQYRVACPHCGVVTETLDFVDPRVTYTKRLAADVALSCQELRNLKSIAQQYQLHWETVKNIDKQALEDRLPPVGETDATLLAVDEFSIKKRHHYATSVIDVETGQVIFVGEDRTSHTLAACYVAMGSKRCQRIQAVAMDMWAAFEDATRVFCPNAEIVYDPFHIIAAYHRDVIDKVRVQEYRKAKGQNKDVFKDSRYLLLKNKANLNNEKNEPARLRDLLALNKRLNTIYVLRDDLKRLWHYRARWAAQAWFDSWYRRAIYSKIEPLKDFARSLKAHLEGILAHCRYPIHTGILEGINNKIKVIKRIAFGFRDLHYFFLKIRGAFHNYHTET